MNTCITVVVIKAPAKRFGITENPQTSGSQGCLQNQNERAFNNSKIQRDGLEQELFISASLYYSICLLELRDHLFKLLDYT